ncbi:hypothetical protein LOS78_01855 [Paracoccus sp. MA]|uniref:hypothetical protein n=1 Tax=Paracoccus sp. MA TaxID=2895796 RepID=UPI001E460344|nr:hypothetical protein [Paracoccus sp. MA]UFM64244.1 hypothetical protein LOS78_01855 [Paracoccus sp. MA]
MKRAINQPREIQATRTQELLGERGPKENHAVRHGDMPNLLADALKVARLEAIKQARKAAAEASGIYGITSFSVADVLVGNSRTQSNPLTILSETVAGFEDGGFVAAFEGFFDNTHVSRSFGDIVMLVNGTQAAHVRIGAKISDPAEGISSMVPFSLTCVFNTPNVAPTIEVRAYAFDADNETTAAAGFYIRAGRLVISGAQ